MKRLLSPKVLHPRPQRQAHLYSPVASAGVAARPLASFSFGAGATTTMRPPPQATPAPAQGQDAPVLALGEHAHEHERQLEHSFFAAGLSEDSLRAISERERERTERQLPASGAQKVVYGFAVCAGLMILAGAIASKLVNREAHRPDLPARAPVVVAPISSQPSGPGQSAPPVAEATPSEAARSASTPAAAASTLGPAGATPAAAVAFGPEPAPAGDQEGPAPEASAPAPMGAVRRPRVVDVRDLRARPAPEPALETGPVAIAGAPGARAPVGEEADEVDEAGPAGPAGAAGHRSLAAAAAGPEDPHEACGEKLRQGVFPEIKATCTAAFEAQPDAQLAADVARAALDERRNREAALWARKAIAVDASFADAFVYLGAAESELGHSRAAREAYGRYLQLEPDGEQAQNVRAIIENL